jgi:hypothetical protein
LRCIRQLMLALSSDDRLACRTRSIFSGQEPLMGLSRT